MVWIKGIPPLPWSPYMRRLLLRPGLWWRWITGERRSVSAESRFYVGDFEGALRQATWHLASYPDDVGVRVLAICCATELGSYEIARLHMGLVERATLAADLKDQVHCLRYMLAMREQPALARTAIRHLDNLFLGIGCRPVRMEEVEGIRVFDALQCDDIPAVSRCDSYPVLTEGPLVSVIMTSFNVEQLVGTSIASILSQGYSPLELIIVDDGSTDGTLKALYEWQDKDKRVRIVAKRVNEGTYVSKNMGLTVARGKYVAFQDSDDWSHPDRLGKSISVLESQPHVLGVTTKWIRMTTEGDMVIQPTGRCAYRSCISLVMRREEVLSRVGYFDSVRAEADVEYIKRLCVVFGDRGVVECPWLLSFGRKRSGSLTASSRIGLVRDGGRPARAKYRRAYRKWHGRVRRSGKGYMPFPLCERPFEVPQVMLPKSGAQVQKSADEGANLDPDRHGS